MARSAVLRSNATFAKKQQLKTARTPEIQILFSRTKRKCQSHQHIIRSVFKFISIMVGWWRGSVVRKLVCSWRTFPDLRLIHG